MLSLVKKLQHISTLELVLFLISIFFFILYLRSVKNAKNIYKKVIQNKFYNDELTNLKNRKALEDYIKDKDSVVIILLDLDSFEDLNTLYGFINAELILVEIAKILKEFESSHNVTAYRLQGDIFALVTTDMRFDDIFTLIEELNQTFLSKIVYIDELKCDIIVSITMGISIFQEEPLITAAMALKKAKLLNQNYFVYNNELDSKELIIQTLYWKEKIKKAVKENRVVPFYQPITDKNRNIVKYEALMRIEAFDDNSENIFITPDKFLGISFKTRQYLELSRIIISKSFENLLKTDKDITINLTFRDILDYNFIDYLDEVMDTLSSEDKSRIVFEILETESLSDYSFLYDFTLKYKKQGIKIAIDDFGSGYSNFLRILKTKPDYIKIDGSLIKDIDKDKNSYEIVKSIVTFSKALNIKTIAEYVHTKEIFDILVKIDVDEFQGYYLGKPQVHFE